MCPPEVALVDRCAFKRSAPGSCLTIAAHNPGTPLVQPATQRFVLEARTCLMTQFPLTIALRIEVMASCLQSASPFCACRLAWKPAEVSSCQVEKPIVTQLVKKWNPKVQYHVREELATGSDPEAGQIRICLHTHVL